jgi:deazaflavin-dependent oxidoreductase (nitroreductase family)
MTKQQPSAASSFNQRIIDEFRANAGAVGGRFEGAPLLLLTTVGARTGLVRTNPVVYLRDGARILIFASNAGEDTNPDWYHNLLADPQVTIEIPEDGRVGTYAARALPLRGEERDRLYETQARLDPSFRDYQAGTSRVIPVVALHLLDLADPERNRAIGEQLVRHHDELRSQLGRVRSEVDELLAGRQHLSGAARTSPGLHHELLGHCLTFCDGLRLHHVREDGAFSAFERRFPSLTPALDRLRQEHRVVATTLAELRQLLDRLAAEPRRDHAAELREELERLAADVEAHFAYEERALLPALGAAPSSSR